MRASTVIASVLGIGYFKIAPGTVMSAVAVPLAFLIASQGGSIALFAATRYFGEAEAAAARDAYNTFPSLHQLED